MHWKPDVGFDPGSPGSRLGPKAGAKSLRHPGIPKICSLKNNTFSCDTWLAQLEDHATLDLGTVGLSPTLGVDTT